MVNGESPCFDRAFLLVSVLIIEGWRRGIGTGFLVCFLGFGWVLGLTGDCWGLKENGQRRYWGRFAPRAALRQSGDAFGGAFFRGAEAPRLIPTARTDNGNDGKYRSRSPSGMTNKKARARTRKGRWTMLEGLGESGLRRARISHLSDDETVAKMGHPVRWRGGRMGKGEG